MSILIRAALLGGLAYVVSRAVRHSQDPDDLAQSESGRLSEFEGETVADGWPTAATRSTGSF